MIFPMISLSFEVPLEIEFALISEIGWHVLSKIGWTLFGTMARTDFEFPDSRRRWLDEQS